MGKYLSFVKICQTFGTPDLFFKIVKYSKILAKNVDFLKPHKYFKEELFEEIHQLKNLYQSMI